MHIVVLGSTMEIRKRLFAVLALVRLFSSVRSLVSFHLKVFNKSLVAESEKQINSLTCDLISSVISTYEQKKVISLVCLLKCEV